MISSHQCAQASVYCKIAEYRHSSSGNLGLNYINDLKQRYRLKYTHTNYLKTLDTII